MKLKDHIIYAGYIGLLTGLFIGLIDALARVAVFSFEWFELYQTMFLTSVFVGAGFILVGLIVGLLFSKLKSKCYDSLSVSFIVFFLLSCIFQRFIFNPFLTSLNTKLIVQTGVLIASALVFYLFYTQKNPQKLFSKGINHSAFKNILFYLVVFIVVCAGLDIYMHYFMMPAYTPSQIDKPNVIFITLDTLRADHLPMHGYDKNTAPNLEKFSTSAVVFDNAISSSSWTVPAHGSMFTGRYPFNHKAQVINQYLSQDEVTLPELLKAQGYNTAGIVSGANTKARYGFAQGFDYFYDRLDFFEYGHIYDKFSLLKNIHYFVPLFHYLGADDELMAEETNALAFKWLDKFKDTSFFLFLHYMDVHDPYTLGVEYRSQFTDANYPYNMVDKAIQMKRYGEISEDKIDYIKGIYDAEIFYLDYHLGKLFDKLEESELMDNTLIIITGDHGEEFYDHGAFFHKKTLYDEVIHVPFMIRHPDLQPQNISYRVENFAVVPTVLDFLNYDIPDNLDTESLIPAIYNGTVPKSVTYSELESRQKYGEPHQRAISINGLKHIAVDPEKEHIKTAVYNLTNDSGEQENIIDDEYSEFFNQALEEIGST